VDLGVDVRGARRAFLARLARRGHDDDPSGQADRHRRRADRRRRFVAVSMTAPIGIGCAPRQAVDRLAAARHRFQAVRVFRVAPPGEKFAKQRFKLRGPVLAARCSGGDFSGE